MVRDERAGSPEDAAELGAAAARQLLESGARAILERVYQAGLPLAGKRIVVTRAEQQAAGLAGMLRSLGAAVEELPAIATVAEPFEAPDLAGFDWLVFSSANGVAHFCDRVACDPRPRVCAVGPATAEALKSRGWRVDLVPARHIAEGVAEALAEAGVAGGRVLWARAAQARDIIPLQLEELGARVAQVAVYRTVAPDGLGESAARVFSSPADWVVFSSGSTVRNLVAAAGVKTIEGARIASIGPVTSAAARELGLEVACEASPSTAEGLVAAILAAGRRP
jgi:uroporphyrinogen-III synthase